MSSNDDHYILFIQQLIKLTNEYKRCEDVKIKNHIKDDILLMVEAIHIELFK